MRRPITKRRDKKTRLVRYCLFFHDALPSYMSMLCNETQQKRKERKEKKKTKRKHQILQIPPSEIPQRQRQAERKCKRTIKLIIMTSSSTLTIIRSLKIITEIAKQMGENTPRTRGSPPASWSSVRRSGLGSIRFPAMRGVVRWRLVLTVRDILRGVGFGLLDPGEWDTGVSRRRRGAPEMLFTRITPC
jgi:hypothetical protein